MRAKSLFFLVLMTILSVGVLAGGDYEKQRQRMIEDINDTVSYTSGYIDKDKLDDAVMQAMGRVPRHLFVPEDMRGHAYVNSALPISHNQTISQPYIVALMTDLAAVDKDSVVLEIGTGSGYQAAVLAELAGEVYSIEIIQALGEEAAETLEELGYRNIHLRIGDGYHGWPEAAPFDAILVTAATPAAPPALIKQLKTGGRLVIPLGRQNEVQNLTVIEKQADGSTVKTAILPVGFVPLTGENRGQKIRNPD